MDETDDSFEPAAVSEVIGCWVNGVWHDFEPDADGEMVVTWDSGGVVHLDFSPKD